MGVFKNTATIVVPRVVHKYVRALVERLALSSEPIRVPVRPIAGAKFNDCFPNVAAMVEQIGGSAQEGWSIWERPFWFVEAEFHRVWVSPKGEWVDITPKEDGEQEILFVSDPVRQWTGVPVDNVRLPISSEPAVKDFIASAEELYSLRMKHVDPLNPTISRMPAEEFQEIARRQQEVERKMVGTFGPFSECYCGSGKKFKWCCGVR